MAMYVELSHNSLDMFLYTSEGTSTKILEKFYRVAQVKLHFLVLGLGGTPLGLGLPFFVRTTSIDP